MQQLPPAAIWQREHCAAGVLQARWESLQLGASIATEMPLPEHLVRQTGTISIAIQTGWV